MLLFVVPVFAKTFAGRRRRSCPRRPSCVVNASKFMQSYWWLRDRRDRRRHRRR